MTKEDFASLLTEYGNLCFDDGALSQDSVEMNAKVLAAKQAVLDAFDNKGEFKMKVAWLIEYRENNITTGYIADITKRDGYDVHMTRDPHKALRFDSRESGQNILDDAAFQHAMGGRQFYVEEHGFYE